MPRSFFRGQPDWTLQGLSETREVGTAEGEGEGSPGEGESRSREAGGGRGEETEGEGEEEGGAIGSPIEDPNARAGEGRAALYPRITISGNTLELDLSPFLDEPSVEQLGAAGEQLKRLIRRIAFRLEMPEGEYCGSFLIAAALVLGARGAVVGQAAVALPSATRLVEAGSGNMGDVEIVPEHTPAVQMLRFIAGTCPLISELTQLMSQIYWTPEVHRNYFGMYRGRPAGWMLHFHQNHTPAMTASVGHIYMRACQVMMLQVLRSSAQEIQRRIDNFDQYFPVFEGLITGFVSDEAQLRQLRDTLQTWLSNVDPSLQNTISGAVTTWREARQLFSTSLSDQILNASEVLDGPDFAVGVPVRRADGQWGVRDGNGREWTMEELEAAINMRHGLATSIDPLINQLSDIPAVADVFRNHPTMARSYLRNLLEEMKSSNAEITSEVVDDYIYAFRSGKIREDLPNRTVAGTSVAMQGVHLMAHQAIGDAFLGNHWYSDGIDFVFDVELGRLGIISFLETSLVLVLSVLCPPAGAALGIVFAGMHYAEATERMEISRSVMNPEELFDQAELELDLFMAQFEIALSIIPELGSIGRGAARGARIVSRVGLRRGVVRIGLEARRALMRSIAEQARNGLVRAFITAVVTDRGMAMIMPHVLGPVFEAVDAELRMMTARPTGAAASSAAAATTAEPLMSVEPASMSSEARPSSPEGIAFYSRLDEYEPSSDEERLPPLEDEP